MGALTSTITQLNTQGETELSGSRGEAPASQVGAQSCVYQDLPGRVP